MRRIDAFSRSGKPPMRPGRQSTIDHAGRLMRRTVVGSRLGNQRRRLVWRITDKKCADIDATNRRLLVDWETANAPWLAEEKRWQLRMASLEGEINRLEAELHTQMGQRGRDGSRCEERDQRGRLKV